MRRHPPPPGRFDDRDRYESLPRPPPPGGPEWDNWNEPQHIPYHGGRDEPGWGDRRNGGPYHSGINLSGGYQRGRRSPSPGWEDGRGKRRRSASPPRFADFDRRGPPPPGRDYRDNGPDPYRNGPPPPLYAAQPYLQRGPEPPSSLPYLVTLRHFADWFRATNRREAASDTAIDKAFKEYRQGFLHKLNLAFSEEMHRKPWFREKYSPAQDMVEWRTKAQAKAREGRLAKFLAELDEGVLDDVSYDYQPEVGSSPSAAVKALAPDDRNGNGTDDKQSPPLNSRAEEQDQAPNLLQTASTLTVGREFVQLEPDDRQLFIKTVTPELSHAALEEHCKKAEGFSHLILSDPNPLKKFYRFGWICFDSVDHIPEGEKILAESTVDSFTLHIQHNTTAIKLRTLIAPGLTNAPERLVKDLDQVRKVAAKFEHEAVEPGGVQAIEARYQSQLAKLDQERDSVAREAHDKSRHQLTKRTLDVYLHYLRTVHASCYYCTLRTQYPEQLHRRCASHYRRPLDAGTIKPITGDKWGTDLDDRLALWLDRDGVDPAQFGGESLEAELYKVCQPHIHAEEESKFRCGDCSKLFSAQKFMAKHIQTKHPELIEGKLDLDRLTFVNNYALDPAKLSFPPDQAPPIGGRLGMNGPLTLTPALPLYPQQMGPPLPIHQAVQSLAGGVFGVGGEMRPAPMGVYGVGGGGGGADGRSRRMRDGTEDREGRVRREGPPPPPPVGARIDPRSAKGERSYADLDDAPAGPEEVVLKY